jgi:hypothetical protein
VNAGDIGYYINVGDLCGKVNAVTSADGVSYSVSPAAWATVGTGSASTLSSLRLPGQAVLKDMGKTIVSSLRTFRKVQLLRNTVQGPVQSTFGVGGSAGTSGEDYLTGYIELGFEGAGVPAPVAHFGR